MIYLDTPLYEHDFDDDFGDGSLNAELAEFHSGGTYAEAAGALRLDLPGGAGLRIESIGHNRMHGRFTARVRVTAHGLADAGAGVNGALLFTGDYDGVNVDYVGLARGAGDATLRLFIRKVRGAVETDTWHGAAPALPIALEIVRDGATTSLAAIDATGARSELAAHTDFSTGAVGVVVGVVSDAAPACWAKFDDLAIRPTWRIDKIDNHLFGCYLKSKITLAGEGFGDGLTATIGGEAAAVTIASDRELSVRLPLFTTPGKRVLEIGLTYGEKFQIVLTYSDKGFKLLRANLPPGRYTTDTTNLLNVYLAAYGIQLDRIDDGAAALRTKEIFPWLAKALLHRWERIFGIVPNPHDDLATRQARCKVRWRADPKCDVATLNAIVDAALSGVTITENEDHSTYGDESYQVQAYEPAPNTLDVLSWANLQTMLDAAAPGWVCARVGHDGFVLSSSALSRDFL